MNLLGKRVLVTGAGGGIGSALVAALLDEGAFVLLTGRNEESLRRVVGRLDASRDRTLCVAADLTLSGDRVRLCEIARQWEGGVDVLINNAGISDFGLLADRDTTDIELSLTTNLTAPIELCRALLPHLQRKPAAQIVNIGSVLGSIGLAGNSIYCAAKFALRGFSEALRRELADTSVRVHYFAPRATRTGINSSAVDEMNAALQTAVDEPADVAQSIVRLLVADGVESVFGWPEKFFARINALLPRLVDRSLRRQLPTVQHFARLHSAAQQNPSPRNVPATLIRRVG